MTRSYMSCDQFDGALEHYLQRSADESTALRVEQHAVECMDCGALMALRIEAASLPELVPSRDLWPQIAARIETPVVELPGTARATPAAPQRWRNQAWLGLAAAALIVVTATITRGVTRTETVAPAMPAQVAQVAQVARVAPQDSTPSLAVPRAPKSEPHLVANRNTVAPPESDGSAGSAASPEAAAERTYDREITRLRAVVSRRRGQLDSSTVATIEENLVVIDGAIKQCKAALRRDPASRFLMESLNDAMDTKVQLLRTAAMLPTKS